MGVHMWRQAYTRFVLVDRELIDLHMFACLAHLDSARAML